MNTVADILETRLAIFNLRNFPHSCIAVPFRFPNPLDGNPLDGRCTADSDCDAGSYCSSKKACTEFDNEYCDGNKCGLGDGGSYKHI